MISIPKRLATARTLPATVADEVVDAIAAKDVPAEFEDSVAEVGVADGADGDFLLSRLS